MPPKRKFIDKKKAVSFQLVHRSQQDPLVVDENAPQRVLLPLAGKEPASGRENVLQEQLPAQVFASEREEAEGMLSKAAPVSGLQLHLDPDIVAAMDEDFDYSDPENELEDNIVSLAEGVASDQEFENEFDMEMDFDSDAGGFGSDQSFDDEETKSRFTSYSMTSSVIRRNAQLTLLDDIFEQKIDEYDENEIGALDCEEIEGHVPENSDILLQYAEEFEKSQQKEKLDEEHIKTKICEILEKSDSEEDMVYMKVPKKDNWDCESILSTYSNIYNHPKVIKESHNKKIKVDKRTGTGKKEGQLTKKDLDALNEENGYDESGDSESEEESVISRLESLSVRPKEETPEEKKERKKMIKEYRRQRRLEKKASMLTRKEATKAQVKININNKNNIQGHRIL